MVWVTSSGGILCQFNWTGWAICISLRHSCDIWGSHCGEYQHCCIMGCDVVQFDWLGGGGKHFGKNRRNRPPCRSVLQVLPKLKFLTRNARHDVREDNNLHWSEFFRLMHRTDISRIEAGCGEIKAVMWQSGLSECCHWEGDKITVAYGARRAKRMSRIFFFFSKSALKYQEGTLSIP